MLHGNLFLWQTEAIFIAESVSFSKINTSERGQEILFLVRYRMTQFITLISM